MVHSKIMAYLLQDVSRPLQHRSNACLSSQGSLVKPAVVVQPLSERFPMGPGLL